MNEQKIIKKCQKGDLVEFSLLYDAYIKKIYNFIYYKTFSKEIAEDLTSQVFIKTMEKIGSFDSSKGKFSSWLYQIARNMVVDHYRAVKNDANIEDAWDLAGDDDLERDADAWQKLSKVEKYLRELKSEQREIIIMRVWQDMSYREIAEILGKSEGNCKMIFSRTMSTLRENMPMELLLYFLLLSC